MVLHTDRNGNRVRTTYNVDGNPVLETGTDAAGKNTITRSWEYDTAGRVRKAAAGGFCYTYEYRADGKLLRKSASGRTLLSCTWFSDGSLESLTDGSGKTIHYRYDWRGKLAAVTDENGQALAEYTHTPGGKLAEILHGNGIRTRYEYDTDGNLVRLHLEKGGGGTISDLYYEYDLNGNRTLKSGSCLLPDGSLAKQEVSYRYDCMDRLTDEVHHGDKTAYVYDSCGNRLKKLDKNGKEEYNYNRKNQLVSRTWDGGYAAYHYDRQGNLLEAAGTEGNTLFAYNVFNRQTAVTMPDGGRLENRYDAEGLRAGTVENSVETRFLYFNGELLSELDEAGDTISRYILGYGATAVWNRGKEGYHSCHLDEQNSTAYITGLDGEIKNSYQYDAFGNLQNRNITVRNRILYTGQQYDEITGQYYLRARFYHPAVGRFLQEDVYRGDGLNLYAYCANNPVVYYDPSGYAPNCKEDGEETATPPTVGLEDIQYARENTMRSERDTIAVGKTDVEGLESQQPFIGGSRRVRKDAGLDSLDEVMPGRDIRAPYNSAQFTNHAEEDVLSQFDKAILELGKDPATISGNLVIAQSNPKGICTLCISGIKNPGRSTGIFKQFSERYPNLTISVSTASVEKAISRCWKSFTIKAGKLIGEPKI